MKKKDFLDRLEKGVLLFDGGIGTQLYERGLKVGDPPESWNLTHPDWVKEIHERYTEAGAEVLTTNSFGGSRFKLEKSGLGNRIYQINFQAAAVARNAAKSRAWVAGSLGPTGEFLEPLGSMKEEEAKESFRIQVKALLAGGADLIIVETMTALDEAVLAVQAVREVGDVPVIGSMTFDKTRIGYRTMMGVDIPSALKGLLDAGADVLGSNCGNGIDNFIPLVAEMRRMTEYPILAEANAGLPKLIDGKTVYEESPEKMASKIPDLLDAGADIIGGCCGTTPEHIRHFKKQIETRMFS